MHIPMRPVNFNAQIATPRLRGRAAVAQRLRRLRAEPLCRDCAAKGIVTAATVVDHIVPLALGGDDSDANTRSLCTPCHGTRTAEQFGHRKRVAVGFDGWPVD
jgi:5-methylcytosine-specific restriction protein A